MTPTWAVRARVWSDDELSAAIVIRQRASPATPPEAAGAAAAASGESAMPALRTRESGRIIRLQVTVRGPDRAKRRARPEAGGSKDSAGRPVPCRLGLGALQGS